MTIVRKTVVVVNSHVKESERKMAGAEVREMEARLQESDKWDLRP